CGGQGMTGVLTDGRRPEEYDWTFGGVPGLARIKPGTILEVFTEDCFAGRVRSERDLVSEVCEFPFLNPQTGPFYVEGAEPGDTLALHFVSIEPARDWAASTTVPLFGALTGTHATALLQEPLPEVVWIYAVDRKRRTVSFQARGGGLQVELPLGASVGGRLPHLPGRPGAVARRGLGPRPARRLPAADAGGGGAGGQRGRPQLPVRLQAAQGPPAGHRALPRRPPAPARAGP